MRTSGRVERIMGSTTILSLFLTHQLSKLLSDKGLRIVTLAPKQHKIAKSHLQLFPKWTTSLKETTNPNSGGRVAVPSHLPSTFLLHSSQSAATAITTNFGTSRFYLSMHEMRVPFPCRSHIPIFIQGTLCFFSLLSHHILFNTTLTFQVIFTGLYGSNAIFYTRKYFFSSHGNKPDVSYVGSIINRWSGIEPPLLPDDRAFYYHLYLMWLPLLK